jgi:hypothetical protein
MKAPHKSEFIEMKLFITTAINYFKSQYVLVAWPSPGL